MSAPCPVYLQFPPTSSFDTFSSASISEISTPITECSDSYGAYDPNHATLLKLISTSISLPAYNIFNLSLFTGTFRALLKFSNVSLLLRGLTIDKEYLTNYHPISNHFMISKITERIVNFLLILLLFRFSL